MPPLFYLYLSRYKVSNKYYKTYQLNHSLLPGPHSNMRMFINSLIYLINSTSMFSKKIIIHIDDAILVKLIVEHEGYIKNSVLRLINILSKKDQIKSLEYSYLSYFDNKINVVIESNENNEVPDELCDPLWILL